jgi:hypothetical protein
MQKIVFSGYAPGAVVYDAKTKAFKLKPGFDHTKDRVEIEMKDDDGYMDGDEKSDEKGEDSNQNGHVYGADGKQIMAGKIYGEEYFLLEAPDGSTIRMDAIEIRGETVAYVPSQPLKPGVAYAHVGGGDIDNLLGGRNGVDTRSSYEQHAANGIVCFGPGTMITTRDGEVPVEWLDTSHEILTRDNGYQPLLWVGRTTLPPGYFDAFPEDLPLRLPAGSLGAGTPVAELQVTGDHRLMIADPCAQLLHASHEVLAPAKAWRDAGIARHCMPEGPYTLTHVLCAEHQIILAQGAWVESMFLGAEALSRLPPIDRALLQGWAEPAQSTARPCLTRREARHLIGTRHRAICRAASDRLRA